MLNKLDPHLLSSISVLGNNKKIKCLVSYDNFYYIKCFLDNIDFANFKNFPFIKSFAIETSSKDLISLAKLDNVSYISSNSKVFAQVNIAKKIIGLENIQDLGEGDFSCAVIDTGIYPHLDFMLGGNKIIAFKDLIGAKDSIYDDNGHGTVVASILAGNGYISGNKYAGVDNKLKLVIVKALNNDGEAGAIQILEAMQWVLDNKKKYNIKIVCMSFGSTVLEKNDPLIAGVEVLWDNGIIVVSACGNSGPESETIKSPSASTKIISVGAMDDERVGKLYSEKRFKVAEFSSRGPILNNYKPDLVVSGVDINSGANFGITKSFYTKTSGTSVATPIVAGVCSLILRKNPNLTPNEVKQILIKSCVKITGDRNAEGYGWLNLKNFFSKN